MRNLMIGLIAATGPIQLFYLKSFLTYPVGKPIRIGLERC